MEYFLIGCGPKSLIFWLTENKNNGKFYTLNSDKEPSDQQISEHHDYLVEIGWYNSDSEDEMKQEEP